MHTIYRCRLKQLFVFSRSFYDEKWRILRWEISTLMISLLYKLLWMLFLGVLHIKIWCTKCGRCIEYGLSKENFLWSADQTWTGKYGIPFPFPPCAENLGFQDIYCDKFPFLPSATSTNWTPHVTRIRLLAVNDWKFTIYCLFSLEAHRLKCEVDYATTPKIWHNL